MRVRHLNCVSSCPLGGYLMDYRSSGLRGRLTCHCLLLELADQLVLVDTGFGLRDVAAPRTRLSRLFLALTSPEFREEMTAVRQLQRLGYDPRDVRHIILSHLDFDHAGGLDDFPGATVHLMARERAAAFAQASLLDRMRYRPQQWSTRAHWRVYEAGEGEPWFGFAAVRALEGLPPSATLTSRRGAAGARVAQGAPVGARAAVGGGAARSTGVATQAAPTVMRSAPRPSPRKGVTCPLANATMATSAGSGLATKWRSTSSRRGRGRRACSMSARAAPRRDAR